MKLVKFIDVKVNGSYLASINGERAGEVVVLSKSETTAKCVLMGYGRPVGFIVNVLDPEDEVFEDEVTKFKISFSK